MDYVIVVIPAVWTSDLDQKDIYGRREKEKSGHPPQGIPTAVYLWVSTMITTESHIGPQAIIQINMINKHRQWLHVKYEQFSAQTFTMFIKPRLVLR